MSGHFHNAKHVKAKNKTGLSLGKEVRKCRICFEKEYFTHFNVHSTLGKRSLRMESCSSLSSQATEHSYNSGAQLQGSHECLNKHPFVARMIIWAIFKVFYGDIQKMGSELISPCECKGSMRFVHRSCLNEWRYACESEKSFYRCEQCLAEYSLDCFLVAKLVNKELLCRILCMLLAVLHFFAVHWVVNELKVIPYFLPTKDLLVQGCRAFLIVALMQCTVYAPIPIVSANICFAWYRLHRFNFIIDQIIIGSLMLFVLWRHFRWLMSVSQAVSDEVYKSYPVNKPTVT